MLCFLLSIPVYTGINVNVLLLYTTKVYKDHVFYLYHQHTDAISNSTSSAYKLAIILGPALAAAANTVAVAATAAAPSVAKEEGATGRRWRTKNSCMMSSM